MLMIPSISGMQNHGNYVRVCLTGQLRGWCIAWRVGFDTYQCQQEK